MSESQQKRNRELAAENVSLRIEVKRLRGLAEQIKIQAQCHAQEARTQRGTVRRVIQAGRPGMGDYEDVPGMVAALRAVVEKMAEEIAAARKAVDVDPRYPRTIEGVKREFAALASPTGPADGGERCGRSGG